MPFKHEIQALHQKCIDKLPANFAVNVKYDIICKFHKQKWPLNYVPCVGNNTYRADHERGG